MGALPSSSQGLDVPTYRSLFARHEFRALWTSSALTTVAATTSSLALATVVHRQTGSALLSAVAMFGPSIAQVLGAGTLMSVADTSPPRRTLTVVGALAAGALALQTIPGLPSAARLAVVLAAAYVVSVGSGVRWGLLTEIVPADAFALGRSAMNVSVGACQVVGFATGGVLLGVLSTAEVFALAAVVAALAVPVLRLGLDEHAPRRSARAGLRETWRGNRALLSGGVDADAADRAVRAERARRRLRGAVRALRRRPRRVAAGRRCGRHADR